MSFQRNIARVVSDLEDRLDRARYGRSRRQEERAARVVTYKSYGTPGHVRIRGRVLYGAAPPPARPGDRWWVNLANTYRRMGTDEVPSARVRVSFCGDGVDASCEAIANNEGHFRADLPLPEPPPRDRLWHEAQVELLEPAGEPAIAMAAVPIGARFGVISDLDDTVLKMDAWSRLRLAREVLFGNVHTRIPFPGVGAFYRALHTAGGALNPLFYVSSSPWNLYDLLNEFLRLHDIPAGPMQLRDWGVTSEEVVPRGHRDHKRRAIDRILDTYPALQFILVGDSGQEDPEIYREVAHAHPERILAIYIRSVVRTRDRIRAIDRLAEELRTGQHADLVLVDETTEAAQHALQKGWIDPGALEGIRRSRASEAAG